MTSSKIKHSYDLITKPCWRERVQRHIASPSLLLLLLRQRGTPRPRTHEVVEGRKEDEEARDSEDGRRNRLLLLPRRESFGEIQEERDRRRALEVPSCAEELPGALRVRGAATRLRGPRVGRCRDRTPHERCCQIGLPLAWHSLFWRGSMWQRCC